MNRESGKSNTDIGMKLFLIEQIYASNMGSPYIFLFCSQLVHFLHQQDTAVPHLYHHLLLAGVLLGW